MLGSANRYTPLDTSVTANVTVASSVAASTTESDR